MNKVPSVKSNQKKGLDPTIFGAIIIVIGFAVLIGFCVVRVFIH